MAPSATYGTQYGGQSYVADPWHSQHGGSHMSAFAAIPMDVIATGGAAYAQYNPYFAAGGGVAQSPHPAYYAHYGGGGNSGYSQFANTAVATPSHSLLNTSLNASYLDTPLHHQGTYAGLYHQAGTPGGGHAVPSGHAISSSIGVPSSTTKATPTALYFADTPVKDWPRYD